MTFRGSFTAWCPVLGETAETGTAILARDAADAAEKYVRVLIADYRVAESEGEPLVIAVSESFEIESTHRIDLATKRVAA